MQTQLIISNNDKFISNEINLRIKKHLIDQYSILIIKPQPSLGIEQVRDLKENLIYKPFTGQYRLVIIYDFHKATIEAQNALLKLFEEPPQKTIILAVSPTVSKILPTIISRCRLIKEIRDSNIDTAEENISYDMLLNLINLSMTQRLLKSSEIAKSKENALIYLNNLLIELSKLLKLTSTDTILSLAEIAALIHKVEGAIKYIEANVSYKGVLDLLFLGFPQKHTPGVS